jgi:hypothetical protein
MKGNIVEQENNLASAIILALAHRDPAPTREEIEEAAKGMAGISGFRGELKDIVNRVLIAIDSRMGIGASLVDNEAEHDKEWVYKRRDISWTYSDAYKQYLKMEGWNPTVVSTLGTVGEKILGYLQDPVSEGAWNRRGLVIGHVQSGKTANYIGLLAKAADAGYKFLIVIAGIHNNLRKQTQERIDSGFIGRSSDPVNRRPTGVGLLGEYPHPATLTTIYDDFKSSTASRSGWQLNDFSKPIVLVIKKNVTTLRSLHNWLKDMNVRGDGQISDVPMLMIDDEADHASINTNKPDLDPTKTNAWIRKILGLFAKSCFLGYTATPFANIFINPEAYGDGVREDLFPKDFIYCLDAPNTYFGPDKVFLEEENSGHRILCAITDCEEYLPFNHKKDHDLHELPPSLYRAVDQFIIVKAIRNHRGQVNRHCSMMVNVSRFVAVQNTVREMINQYIARLREAVQANYALPEEYSSENVYMQKLKEAFLRYFNSNHDVTWAEVKKVLLNAFDTLRVYVINSKSDESLDYNRFEKDGEGLTAIAVGGLSLSRGLTIEGLCVSYMYRNTRMYDTLMQMGRWFGYRPGYEDLCRVHLSLDSIDWYAHIAEASEELRQQVKRMGRDGLTPRQFGLYVQSHPQTLLVTAANKMRYGERVVVRQNYSGKLRENHILPTDVSINFENEELIKKFWRNSFSGDLQEIEKGWFASDVSVRYIEEFLEEFKVAPDFAPIKSAILSYLRAIEDFYPYGDVLLISMKNNDEDSTAFKLGYQERFSATLDENKQIWRTSKNRVASKGDEKLGLSSSQHELAAKYAAEQNPPKEPQDMHYRLVREKPLLMVHILGLKSIDDKLCRVPSFGVSFPFGNYTTEIEVVANRVWLEAMCGPVVDTPDEEEDFDETHALG